MTEHSWAWLRDRAMSVHHRAYEHIQEGLPYWRFCEYLLALAERDDDPELMRETTTQQIWDTALAAYTAGMQKRQAFPLSNQLA